MICDSDGLDDVRGGMVVATIIAVSALGALGGVLVLLARAAL